LPIAAEIATRRLSPVVPSSTVLVEEQLRVERADDVRAGVLAERVGVGDVGDGRTDAGVNEAVEVAVLDVLALLVGEQDDRGDLLDVEARRAELATSDGLRCAFADDPGGGLAEPDREDFLLGVGRALVSCEGQRAGLLKDGVDERASLLVGDEVAAGRAGAFCERDLVSHVGRFSLFGWVRSRPRPRPGWACVLEPLGEPLSVFLLRGHVRAVGAGLAWTEVHVGTG
jgi:hypothetical protein